MWKLNIDKSFEAEYIHRMLPSLVTRVKTWKGGTSLYKSFRSELLPDWNRDHPVETDVLEKLLIAKPTEAHALNEQLMKKFVVGYSEADSTQKILQKKYRRRQRILACVLIMMGLWETQKVNLIGWQNILDTIHVPIATGNIHLL